jgi:hypothetical protein
LTEEWDMATTSVPKRKWTCPVCRHASEEIAYPEFPLSDMTLREAWDTLRLGTFVAGFVAIFLAGLYLVTVFPFTFVQQFVSVPQFAAPSVPSWVGLVIVTVGAVALIGYFGDGIGVFVIRTQEWWQLSTWSRRIVYVATLVVFILVYNFNGLLGGASFMILAAYAHVIEEWRDTKRQRWLDAVESSADEDHGQDHSRR